jgi:hypothetical protein
MRKVVVVVSLLGAGLVPLLGPSPAGAGGGSTITVETTADGFTSSPMTLRQAVALAATDGGLTTIVMPPGEYQLTICAASGLEDENLNVNGDLDQVTVSEALVFQQQALATGNVVIRQTCEGERVIHAGDSVSLLDVDVTGGSPSGSGGGVNSGGNVLVDGGEIHHNSTQSSGGGIFAAVGVTLLDAEMDTNEAAADGGGIRAGSFVGLTDSQVTDNNAGGIGGGIRGLGSGDVSLTRATVGRNQADEGGGIQLETGGSVVLEDSTVAQNRSTSPTGSTGGILAADQVVASQSTIASNETDGIAGFANISTLTLSANETVIADPVGGVSCSIGSASSDGYNVEEGDDSCELGALTDLQNTGDPGLQRLFFNGGPTETLYLAKTSFLREGAPTTSNGCSNGGTDQRGVARPQGALCDVGAVEIQPCGQFFSDVAGSHPFCWEIGWMSEAGITTGFPGGIYKPNDAVKRQSMSAFLYRLAGEPEFADPPTATFSDVATSSTFFTEIEWMNAAGITTGFPGGLFKPNDPVKRQSMSAFMFRMVDPTFADPPFATFNDVPTTSAFFTEIEWMAFEGITTGFPGDLFKPNQDVTRQSMSAFMFRLAPFLSGGVQF